MLVGCDIYKPAAIDQLETLAQGRVPVYGDQTPKMFPLSARQVSVKLRRCQPVVFDTAGRLQIDTDLVEEIKRLRAEVNPDEVFLVADSALGQEAVNVAKTYEAVDLQWDHSNQARQ